MKSNFCERPRCLDKVTPDVFSSKYYYLELVNDQSFTHSSNNISTWPGPPKMFPETEKQTNGETQKRRNGARPVWRRILTTTLGGPGCSHDPPPPHPVPLYIFKAPNGVWVPDSHLSPFSGGIRVPDSNWRIPDSHLHVSYLHLRPFSSGNPGSGFELEDSGFSLAGSGFSSAPIFFGEFRFRIRTEAFRPFTCGCRTPTFFR